MDFNFNYVNPWALFRGDESPPINIYDNIIDSRFPNNFTKSSSLVTCNFCNVILLKNHAPQHFKIHHNKNFKKKFSKFKIPFNAVEGYELICEIRRKKQVSSNINMNNKSKELFKLKHKHSENNITKQSSKIQSKLMKNSSNSSKYIEAEEYLSPKVINISEKVATKNNEMIPLKNIQEKKLIRGILPEIKNGIKLDNKRVPKRSMSIVSQIDNKMLKAADLKLNIRINSDGLLTSSIKGDNDSCSNIFDKMSNFCDNSVDSKSQVHSTLPKCGVIKQSGYDKSYGCTIFTDQFNNSILIDNDKEDGDDYDCCESSLSNDSAYFSLPNTTTNAVTTSASKTLNLCTASVAPPLVTAYQYSNSANKISYSSNGSQFKSQTQSSAPMTMHVTRSLSYNSIVPPKSTVKHRFYVSGHSNQTIVNTLRKTSSENNDLNFLIDNENDESLFDLQTNGVLHSLSKESQDLCYINNKSSYYQNQKHSINSKTYINDMKTMTNTRLWNCFEENGLSVNVLIPKRLKWIQSKSRKKSLTQLGNLSSKQSPNNIHKHSLSLSTIEPSAPDNPLLTSYTIESNSIDDILQSDPILTSEILLDYQFPDRNQMCFQQRLLERGVISQRDIVRSQRCLSFNINAPPRKTKNHPTKSNILEYKRIFGNTNYAVKTQVLNRNGCISGYNVPHSIPCTTSQIKSTVPQQPKLQPASMMSQIVKTNSVPKHILPRHKQLWYEDGNLSRVQNVSTFHEQCLSQNCKYINSDSKVTVSPQQSRNTLLSTTARTLDKRNTAVVFRSSSPNPSIDSFDAYKAIFTAQNTLPNDSNHYSQQMLEKKCINMSNNDISYHHPTSENEFVKYSQSYDDYNPPSMTLHPNYQTIFNSQNKFSNHSTNHYNANFEM